MPMASCSNELITITLPGGDDALWTYQNHTTRRVYTITPPEVELNGDRVRLALREVELDATRQLPAGGSEYQFAGEVPSLAGLRLAFVVQVHPSSAIVRFQYRVWAAPGTEVRLTKTNGSDNLSYLGLRIGDDDTITEVRFSEFADMVHSYLPTERPVNQLDAENDLHLMGPLLAVVGDGAALAVAYEHGSQLPDAYLHFRLGADKMVNLAAVKGNYLHGQPLDAQGSHPAPSVGIDESVSPAFATVWMHLGAVSGELAELRAEYRNFILRYQSEHPESRKPYLFYNTWNLQERTKWWKGGRYLDPMTEEQILADIDRAAALGIEVYVLDTGWYRKTGEWLVNEERFSTRLQGVRDRLTGHGMRLGLWFGPPSAAVSCRIVHEHPAYQMSRNGVRQSPRPIWETEESVQMCLVGPYGDHFADQLIRVARQTGTTYFKWDAVGQYGCDAAGHGHGGPEHDEAERASHYAFRLPLRLAELADRICREIPGAIVDFDVTEPGRAVGLAFLAAGKYFMVNNGPYYANFDVAVDPETQNTNLFFFPGQARARICRTPLAYDTWIPSTLFLTHYLPDGPTDSQLTNLGSLILGHNGIWGDLSAITPDGVGLIAEVLEHYKRVRQDMTASVPVTYGSVGATPEIHEKVSTETGRGAVVAFSPSKGTFDYITSVVPSKSTWQSPGAAVEYTASGHARMTFSFERAQACMVFFG